MAYRINANVSAISLAADAAVTGVDFSASGTLGVSGVATLDSASITNSATVGTTLGVTGASTLADTSTTTLSSSGLATLDSLGVTNAATVGTTLGVTGTSTLAATNTTTLSSSGLATLNSASVTTTLGVTGASTLADTSTTTLSSSGLATLDSLGVTNAATVGTTLGVTGTSTLAATNTTTLSSSGLATLDSASVTTTLGVSGAATVNSLGVTNAATVGTTLGVTGLSTLDSASVTNALTVNGATTLGTSFDANNIVLNNLAEPVVAQDCATMNYVDTSIASALSGLSSRAAAQAGEALVNVVLTGLQVVDGVSLSDGDRVLLMAQTDAKENIIWLARAGAWERAPDFQIGSSQQNAYVFVDSGTRNADTGFVQATDNAIVGTSDMTWNVFSRNLQVDTTRFVWTANVDTVYTAATLSGIGADESIKLAVEIVQRDDAAGTAWMGEIKGLITDPSTFLETFNLGTSGSTLAVAASGPDLVVQITNPTGVARSGYIKVGTVDNTGDFFPLTVVGGANSSPH